MPTFQYSARDQNGELHSGVIVADNERHMREQVRSRGLYVTNIGIIADMSATGGEKQSLFKRKVKLYDMVVMSRQLATLIRAGITIIEALDAVALQSSNPVLVKALMEIRQRIIGGASLSEAMRLYPEVFSDMYCALVAAGERGGTLDETLELAAVQLDKQQDLREQVKSALIYPVLVIFVAFGVIALVLTIVVPVFKKVYDRFGHELPSITRFLLGLSNIVMNWWFVVVPALIAVALLLRAYISTDEGRKVFDQVKLRLWLLGPLFRKIGVAEFTQTFTGLIRGGVPIIGAMQVAAGTSSNVIIQAAIIKASEAVKEGSPLAVSLEETGQFPPMVTRMVASGERAGNLDEMLLQLTKFYERDIEHTVQRLTKVMEPVLTIVVGGIVLFTLLALYMPIFTLSQVIKR